MVLLRPLGGGRYVNMLKFVNDVGLEEFPAHIRQNSDTAVQSVKEHCMHTAEYAAQSLTDISLSNTSFLSGLLHDLGKMTSEYREYLKKAVCGDDVVRGSVNHTFAGVRYILDNFHNPENTGEAERITAELIAIAIGSHHGLFDCVDEKHCSGYTHRLQKSGIPYDEAVSNYLAHCVDKETLLGLFQKSTGEITAMLRTVCEISGRDESGAEAMFYLSMASRMITSAVIEGDRRDTAEFMNQAEYPATMHRQECVALWSETLYRVENKLNRLNNDSKINKARQRISQICREKADAPGGLYRMNVPTGGGKTIASLRFSIKHAERWGKSRIFFISPLLSILEQNASVIREFVQNDDIVLEHHSNVVNVSESMEERLDQYELLTDNWNSPIVITTLVQFLNTLFCGKTTCIRRFQALCSSVIVIDEVQTVPNNMLTLFNLAMNYLTELCNVTVVLCSATQPCLEQTEHSLLKEAIDIVPYDAVLWDIFKRTRIVETESMQLEEIPDLAEQILAETENLLIVCNKKSEAETLFKALAGRGFVCYHLSAAMCVAHRRSTVNKLKAALNESRQGGEKIVCVSTQVIEAGVDISFASVIRLSAGMDSVVQAAGRCNRNSESDIPAPVYLVQCRDERLSFLKEIQRAKEATTELLYAYRKAPHQFKDDLMSYASINCYYQQLYRKMPLNFQDFSIKKDRKTFTLFSLLSTNGAFVDMDFCSDCEKYFLNQAFKTAGQEFSVFDNSTSELIVPYDAGKEIINEICSLYPQGDLKKLGGLIEEIKPYTVSVYSWQRQTLEENDAIISLFDGKIQILREEYYDNDIGMTMKNVTMDFMEV